MKLFIRCMCLGSLVGLLLFSCNIFEPSDREAAARWAGADALVQEGMIKMQAAQWDEAISLFNEALGKDSSKSEAYFYKGKCLLRKSDVDLSEVWSEINPSGDVSKTNKVPFLYSDSALRNVMGLSNKYYTYINPITHANAVDHVTIIDSVFLERKRVYDAVCSAIGFLEKIYYNADQMDGHIVRKQFESDYLIEISVKTILQMMDLNNNDSLDYIDRDGSDKERKAFKIFCEDIPDLDHMTLDSLRQISNDPKEINAQLDLLLLSVNKADTSYNHFAADLRDGASQSSQLDTNMAVGIGDMIGSFKDIIPYFYFNDTIDNDGCYYNTDSSDASAEFLSVQNNDLRRDRMVWIDWDNDKKIDLYPLSYQHVVGVDSVHIGGSRHIAKNPTLYTIINPQDTTYKRYRYSGPHTYEFIAGDFSVDEEVMDGKDNDLDGLTDEDTRSSPDTLDDDSDWVDVNGDGIPQVTEWNDANHNFKLDLVRLKGTANWTTLPNGEWTAGDWGIDEEMFDGIDNDGDGKIDEDNGKMKPDISLPQYRTGLIDSVGAAHRTYKGGY